MMGNKIQVINMYIKKIMIMIVYIINISEIYSKR